MEHARQHDDDARAAQPSRGGSPQGAPTADAPPGGDAQSRDAHSRDDQAREVPEQEHSPIGAVAVTGFLTVTILVLWFGMYALNLSRS